MEKTKYIWINGEFVKWESAKVHVLTYSLHYGYGVFEGIRVYKLSNGKRGIFCLQLHIKRLLSSAKILGINVPYTAEEIQDAVKELVIKNDLEEGYIRPIVFIGEGEMGLYAFENPVIVSISCWPWGTYLGEKGLKEGIRVKISSYSKNFINSSMPKAKVCGYYVVSVLAKKEAVESGYDEAVLLDPEGYVSEGAGENLFIVRDGVVKTPETTYALEGITRMVAIEIMKSEGIKYKIGKITRDELYISDEAFLTGTAAEITPIREVDGRKIGNGDWKITRRIQEKFFRIVRGKDEEFMNLITVVE